MDIDKTRIRKIIGTAFYLLGKAKKCYVRYKNEVGDATDNYLGSQKYYNKSKEYAERAKIELKEKRISDPESSARLKEFDLLFKKNLKNKNRR